MIVRETPEMSEEIAAKALTLVKEMGFKQHQAAAALGVNQGRVSEVLTGKRYPGIKPYPKDKLLKQL